MYVLRNVTEKNAVYDNPNEDIVGCDHLKYVVQPVRHTNMILLVIDTRGCRDVKYKMSVEPEELTMINSSLACTKKMSSLPRVKPISCIRNHTRESEIKDLCGRAGLTSGVIDFRLFVLSIILTISLVMMPVDR